MAETEEALEKLLRTDFSGLSDEQLAALFAEADKQQKVASQIKRKIEKARKGQR